MAAVAAKAEVNAREIERLRERSHDYGNELQRAIAGIENVGAKLDAIHVSTLGRIAELRAEVKEDLTELKTDTSKSLGEIKTQTTRTNGRVGKHDGQISRIQGAVAALCFFVTVGAPVALFLVPHIH